MCDLFFTNTYRVLRLIEYNSMSIGELFYCPLGQREIATELGLSRVAVNKIFQDLKTEGYIEMVSRGKWKVTEKAETIVKAIDNLNF